MTIRIVHYATSASSLVQAFIDVEIDSWLRFNGLNYHRDGALRPAQLTQMLREGKRSYRDAVAIPDPDLEKLAARAETSAPGSRRYSDRGCRGACSGGRRAASPAQASASAPALVGARRALAKGAGPKDELPMMDRPLSRLTPTPQRAAFYPRSTAARRRTPRRISK